MTRTSNLLRIENMNAKLFFLLLFLYQILFTFQGVDLADEGFYATFYSQIYRAPETVQFNFMFWLSGIAGGAFLYLFNGLGLWGLRLAGVLITTGTIILTYHILKNYLQKKYLMTGLFLVTLLLSNDPKEIYYNNLSAFLYIVVAYFLFTGLKENKQWKLFLSGFFVALNIFSRLPNLLGVGIGIIILYYSFEQKETIKAFLKKISSFLAGIILAIVGVVAVMKMLGHFEPFINSVKLVIGLGQGSLHSKGQGSSYGLSALIRLFFTNYENSIKYTIYIIAFLLFILAGINYFRKKSFYRTWHPKFIAAAISLFFILLIVTNKLQHIELIYCFTGLTLITAVLILFLEDNKDIKLLTLTGGFILLVQPLGSSGGIHQVGQYSMWLIFPVALNYLFNIKAINNHFSVLGKKTNTSFGYSLTESQLNNLKKYGLIVSITGCLFQAYYYPYFDKQERLKMHYAINNSRFNGIYTTRERAAMINELLQAGEKYIKPDDYLLAYECIPMLHYLTATKPYIRNSWPYLYMAGVFKNELADAFTRTKILPVVVIQKINTVGDASNWPHPSSVYDDEWNKLNEERNAYLDDFLTMHNYQEVWNNRCFKIMIPAKDSL